MNPGHYDFNVRRNSTVVRTFYLKDKDGNAIQLPNNTGKMQVRKGPGAEVILELSTDSSVNGSLMIDAALGSVRVEIPYTTMATKPVGNFLYDIRLLNTAVDAADYILDGKFVVKAVITE